MNDAGRHMGLFTGRMDGRAGGRFGGRMGSVMEKKVSAAPPSEWDEDFLAFWERTSGTMNDDWKASYNQLVKDLKSAGIWQKADIIYCFASANEADARLNLKSSSFGATAYNSPTFTAKSGFTGGGTAFLDTNYSPINNAINYKTNDAECIISLNSAFNANLLNKALTGLYYTSICIAVIQAISGPLLYGVNSNYNYFTPSESIDSSISVGRNSSSYHECLYDSSSRIDNQGQTQLAGTAATTIPILAWRNNFDVERFSAANISGYFIGGYTGKKDDFTTAINAHKARVAAL